MLLDKPNGQMQSFLCHEPGCEMGLWSRSCSPKTGWEVPARQCSARFAPVVSGHGSFDGSGGAGPAARLSRTQCRDESAGDSRDHLPEIHSFYRPSDAAGEPVPALLVVSHGVQAAGRVQGQDSLAGLRWSQLSRQCVDEWPSNRFFHEDGRNLAALRIRCHRGSPSGRSECSGGRSISPATQQPGDDPG